MGKDPVSVSGDLNLWLPLVEVSDNGKKGLSFWGSGEGAVALRLVTFEFQYINRARKNPDLHFNSLS